MRGEGAAAAGAPVARGGLTHQRAEGHDAEQPLQEDAEAVHERAALAAARAGRGGGRRPSRQRAARVPGGALHGPPGRPGRSGASLPRGRATDRGPETEQQPELGAAPPPRGQLCAAVTRRLRPRRWIGPARRGGGATAPAFPRGRGSAALRVVERLDSGRGRGCRAQVGRTR